MVVPTVWRGDGAQCSSGRGSTEGCQMAVYACSSVQVRLRRLFLAVLACLLVCYGTLAASTQLRKPTTLAAIPAFW